MTTHPRRTLGTGPTSTTRSTTTSPRLLPAERADRVQLDVGDDSVAEPARIRRRMLGRGVGGDE